MLASRGKYLVPLQPGVRVEMVRVETVRVEMVRVVVRPADASEGRTGSPRIHAGG